MNFENPSDIEMFLQLGSVMYAFIIFIRGARVLAIQSGFENSIKEITIIAIIMVIIMFSGSHMMGWAAAIYSLLSVTSMIVIYTIVTGGMAAGALLQDGSGGFIPSILLIIASISLGFFEPIIAAPFCTAALGLNIYLEYQDIYGVLNSSLWNSELAHYIFVYPPLVFLFTLTDIIVITPMIGQKLMALFVTILTIIGMVFGFHGY